ncbi:uncharacterized protein [Nicotiana tomentosiformis]|uniref:uncharacterized protein n=1 Tax=Nicotiana tomentosiformis TaxID=4098 RepID=UPI00388C3E4E
MVIENQKFSDIIKLGERIEEGIKSGMVINFEALHATNKALQSGGISKKKEVGAVMVAQGPRSPLTYQTPPPTYQLSPPRYPQPATAYHTYNTQPAYYHSLPSCQNYQKPRPNFDRRLPRQYTPIDEPIDQLYERLKAAGYVTPIPAVAMENSSQWVNPNKTCAYYSGMKGHTFDKCRTLEDKSQTLIDTKVIQEKEAAPNVRNNPLPDHRGGGAPIEVEVAVPTPFEVEVTIPFTMMVTPTLYYKSNAIPWDYVAEARRKGKGKMEETGTAQGVSSTGRKSILSLLQNSEAHRNALMKVLNEACVPNDITSGEMVNMTGQVLESHKITFHEDELPPEGLSHNRALHITVQFEDKFIARVLIDGGLSLNICLLTTLKR